MSGLLLPVDPENAARTRAAVGEAIRLARAPAGAVHVLSVVPEVSGHISRFLPAPELGAMQQAQGQADMADACRQLAEAGVAFQAHVRVGRRAETIARAARELACDTVVLDGPVPADLADRLFGSVAQQVRQRLGAGTGCRVIGA
jgi:nucleotide-binding universal stress UspA family protein